MGAVTPTRVIGGRYVVLAELGRGGMGIVWRAEDRMMGRQVAVKELHLPDGPRAPRTGGSSASGCCARPAPPGG